MYVLLQHAAAPGFRIVNSFPPAAGRANATPPLTAAQTRDGMRRATFCWVPPGQRYGDARRHIIAAFHGCIPVFTVPDGHHTLEEVLPWHRMALSVPQEQLPLLPQILRNVSAEEREEMRRKRLARFDN